MKRSEYMIARNKKELIKKRLSPILWDYAVSPYDFYEVAAGRKHRAGHFTRSKAVIRMLERLWWYDLIELFGAARLRTMLTDDIIAGIRIPELKEKYEIARRGLSGEPLSLPGWNPSSCKKARSS